MARRLLGADSATVFNIQEPEEETANQVLCSSGLRRKLTISVSPLPSLYGHYSWYCLYGKYRADQRKRIILFIFTEHILYARYCVKWCIELFQSVKSVLFTFLLISLFSFQVSFCFSWPLLSFKIIVWRVTYFPCNCLKYLVTISNYNSYVQKNCIFSFTCMVINH